MPIEPTMVSLGFTKQAFPAGVHICQVFNNDHERLDSLLKFLQSGLLAGERTACFTEQPYETLLAARLAEDGRALDAFKAAGALISAPPREVYFQDGNFDPERILARLRRYHQDALADGFSAARLIGEMSSDVLAMPGGSRLMEYEARVSLLLRTHPLTAVCQYDANSFDGATIMEILKVHPLMVLRGNVVHNPFFVSPEAYLAGHC
ncbi:MEDS domain-containing protein [Candidatus Accumulibacter sp. ACC003]|uniref:MEDS domain-containing protein n=1 Tax=Candidatus Accumulibacter sp. ACC003 TaxID=2823334 RepID=UPI0025BA1492|nr:MEDS domain-containing protein [Candidatus Accumulibacter sp. ACC003]